jgi:DNA ligase D-like protein (predicted 3'-phosphoesterase)
MSDQLNQYIARRDFRRTPEPRPGSQKPDHNGPPRFVLQEHEARRHHFDLRLEVGGVLVSWVVPRGPAFKPGERRLALRMEDHPLAYADFEGKIPEGQYGSGTVEIWDHGTFENITTRDNESIPATLALDAGRLVVRLEGEKLHGGYIFERTEANDDEERWVLIKAKDNAKN